MIEKSCRCGKSKKNFKRDIGPFYVEECCLEAGFDELGVLKELASNGEDMDKKASIEEQKANIEASEKLEKERKKAEKAAKRAAEKLAKESKK